jgi:uncharacterized RDD family membrane protein YckC
MSSLGLTYPHAATQTANAGFWARVFAKLVDFAFVSICLLPLDISFGTSFVIHTGRSSFDASVVAFAIFCVYSALMESSPWQATFGKRLAGVLVEDSNGQRITLSRALCRSAVQILSTFDYLFAAFTSRKQALHDLAVDTLVVYGTL